MATISIMGDSSGSIDLTVPAAAGSHVVTLPSVTGTALVSTVSMTLPTALGSAGSVLTTDGAGNLSWGSSGGLTVGATTITSGASGSLLTEVAGGLLGEILMGTGVAAALAIDTGIADGLAIQASAFTQGSALFADASGKVAENNASYFWDDANTQLLVGTNTPVTSPADIQFVVSKDAYINGITAGRGNGQDSTNTVFGAGALATSGTSNNTAFGSNALNVSSSGGLNAAFGSSALENNSGSGNTGIGHNAMKVCSGSRNTAVGRFAMGFASVQGSQNTALGISALGFVTSGADNVAIGSSSGSGITTGSSNVVIGSYTGASAPINATGDNFIVLSDGSANIGAYWDGTTSNQFCQGPVILKNYTFATLPTPPIRGMRAYITDATAAPTFLAVAAGGGTTVAPVFYDGTNWVFG